MPTYGYWNLRALGQSIRFLLHYCGEEFEEKLYDIFGSKEDWLSEKFTLDLEYPNLPYYIDGEVKLTQSLAILGYIGDKHNLTGGDKVERAKINMYMYEGLDYRTALARVTFSDKFEEQKEGAIKDQHVRNQHLEERLKDKEFLNGKISIADFVMYEALYCWGVFEPALIDNYPSIKKYVERFQALPKIKAYMESDGYIKGPLHHPGYAKWGNEKPT